MPPKKKTTERKKAKRDIFDFFEDASREDSTAGMDFLEELNNKRLKARDIYNRLIEWGYDGVRPEDVTKLVNMYRTKGHVKGAIIDMKN